MEKQVQAPPFGLRDKAGYLFGDLGNDFTFLLASGFMMKFYTDVMGIAPGTVGLLMMLARFLDAFTDVTMGQLTDRSPSSPGGRFRPWILRMCGPAALSSFLIYQSGLAGMPYGFKVLWMFGTYILWGSVFYTSINIPYGSMASAISADPGHRTQLSAWRTAGSTLASLVIGAGTPLIAYETVNGVQVLSGPRMTAIAGVFSVLAVLCYLLCYRLVRERVQLPPRTGRIQPGRLLKSLFSSRALLGILLAAVFVLLAMLTMQGMASYVFPNYYRSTGAQSLAAVTGSAVMLGLCAPTAAPLSARLGKKELSVLSCLFSAAVYGICLLVRPASAWGFVTFYTLAYAGMGYFNTVIWAMITDVIDDAELRTGQREDGTIYSVYSFARKLGQAFSAGLTGSLLNAVGYSEAAAFDPEVTSGIFTISCLAPFIGFLAVALSLQFVYPLGKKQVERNIRELEKKRTERKAEG